jgi:hypothetical protein
VATPWFETSQRKTYSDFTCGGLQIDEKKNNNRLAEFYPPLQDA